MTKNLINLTISSAALAVAVTGGVFSSTGSANAQSTQLSVPSGLCGFEWSGPSGAAVIGGLVGRDDLRRNMTYMANTCPEAFCSWDWSTQAAEAALQSMQSMSFFSGLIEDMGELCPGVLQIEAQAPTAGLPADTCDDDNDLIAGGDSSGGDDSTGGGGPDGGNGANDGNCGGGNDPGHTDPDNPGQGGGRGRTG